MDAFVRAAGVFLTLAVLAAVYVGSSGSPSRELKETTATLLERISECETQSHDDAGDPQWLKTDCSHVPNVEAGRLKKARRSQLVRVSFVGAGGATHEAKVHALVAPPSARIGDKFPVFYDPAKPDDLRPPYAMHVSGVLIASAILLGLILLLGAAARRSMAEAGVTPYGVRRLYPSE